MRLSADGAHLYATGHDGVFRLDARTLQATHHETDWIGISTMAVHPDGQRLFGTGGDILDAATLKTTSMYHAIGGQSHAPIMFSPDSTLVITARDLAVITKTTQTGGTGRQSKLPGIATAVTTATPPTPRT
ncbi:hypothetical protein ABZZ17_20130 [Streptomyces sp. NPDC006512]|uniref:hypothetical protein n=1 Tax=Streptomyces sp. NPDC006512 TaxID=3154307 RepID=UPI0033B4D236